MVGFKLVEIVRNYPDPPALVSIAGCIVFFPYITPPAWIECPGENPKVRPAVRWAKVIQHPDPPNKKEKKVKVGSLILVRRNCLVWAPK